MINISHSSSSSSSSASKVPNRQKGALTLNRDSFGRCVSCLTWEEGVALTRVCRQWNLLVKSDQNRYKQWQVAKNFKEVIRDIPLARYPKEFREILKEQRINLNIIPRAGYSRFPNHQVEPVNIHTREYVYATCFTRYGGFSCRAEMLTFRFSGETSFLPSCYGNRKAEGIFSISQNFRNENTGWANFWFNGSPLVFGVYGSLPYLQAVDEAPINYAKLKKIFNNPHSIIALYCGNEMPAIDLREFFVVPNHSTSLI